MYTCSGPEGFYSCVSQRPCRLHPSRTTAFPMHQQHHVTPRRDNILCNPDRRLGASKVAPSQWPIVLIWKSQRRLVTETPEDRRRRHSSGIARRVGLASTYFFYSICCCRVHRVTPRRSSRRTSLYVGRVYIRQLHTLQVKRQCWEVVLYPKCRSHIFLKRHFVY